MSSFKYTKNKYYLITLSDYIGKGSILLLLVIYKIKQKCETFLLSIIPEYNKQNKIFKYSKFKSLIMTLIEFIVILI
jgi:hypothetical protein